MEEGKNGNCRRKRKVEFVDNIKHKRVRRVKTELVTFEKDEQSEEILSHQEDYTRPLDVQDRDIWAGKGSQPLLSYFPKPVDELPAPPVEPAEGYHYTLDSPKETMFNEVDLPLPFETLAQIKQENIDDDFKTFLKDKSGEPAEASTLGNGPDEPQPRALFTNLRFQEQNQTICGTINSEVETPFMMNRFESGQDAESLRCNIKTELIDDLDHLDSGTNLSVVNEDVSQRFEDNTKFEHQISSEENMISSIVKQECADVDDYRLSAGSDEVMSPLMTSSNRRTEINLHRNKSFPPFSEGFVQIKTEHADPEYEQNYLNEREKSDRSKWSKINGMHTTHLLARNEPLVGVNTENNITESSYDQNRLPHFEQGAGSETDSKEFGSLWVKQEPCDTGYETSQWSDIGTLKDGSDTDNQVENEKVSRNLLAVCREIPLSEKNVACSKDVSNLCLPNVKIEVDVDCPSIEHEKVLNTKKVKEPFARENKIFTCSMCKLNFSDVPSIRSQCVSEAAITERILCANCVEISKTEMTKTQTEGQQSGTRPINETSQFECAKCIMKFASKKKFESHLRSKHIQIKCMNKPVSCRMNDCGRLMRTTEDMIKHYAQDHGTSYSNLPSNIRLSLDYAVSSFFACTFCEKRFWDEQWCLKHIKGHVAPQNNLDTTQWSLKKYHCNIQECQLNFSTKLALKLHQESGHGTSGQQKRDDSELLETSSKAEMKSNLKSKETRCGSDSIKARLKVKLTESQKHKPRKNANSIKKDEDRMCLECTISYKREPFFAKHVRKCHMSQTVDCDKKVQYSCSVSGCDSSFKKACNLEEHCRKNHSVIIKRQILSGEAEPGIQDSVTPPSLTCTETVKNTLSQCTSNASDFKKGKKTPRDQKSHRNNERYGTSKDVRPSENSTVVKATVFTGPEVVVHQTIPSIYGSNFESRQASTQTEEVNYTNTTCSLCLRGFSTAFDLDLHRKLHDGNSQGFCVVCRENVAKDSQIKLQKHMLNIHFNGLHCGECSSTAFLKQHFCEHLVSELNIRKCEKNNCKSLFFTDEGLKKHTEVCEAFTGVREDHEPRVDVAEQHEGDAVVKEEFETPVDVENGCETPVVQEERKASVQVEEEPETPVDVEEERGFKPNVEKAGNKADVGEFVYTSVVGHEIVFVPYDYALKDDPAAVVAQDEMSKTRCDVVVKKEVVSDDEERSEEKSVTVRKTALETGAETAVSTPEIKCCLCEGIFPSKSAVDEHTRIYHGIYGVKCKYMNCREVFPHKAYLKEHVLMVHLKEFPFRCKLDGCKRGFTSELAMLRHRFEEHQFSCKCCQFRTIHHRELIKHMDEVHKQNAFVCRTQDCDGHFESLEELKKHVQAKHWALVPALLPYRCSVPGCHMAFLYKNQASEHGLKVHNRCYKTSTARDVAEGSKTVDNSNAFPAKQPTESSP